MSTSSHVAARADSQSRLEQRNEEKRTAWPMFVLGVGSSALLIYTLPSWGPMLRRSIPMNWLPSSVNAITGQQQQTSVSSSTSTSTTSGTSSALQSLLQHGTTVGMAIAGSLLLHRAMGALVDVIERECTVTAVFDSKDDAWRWVMEWLSESKAAQTTSLVGVLTSWRPWGHRSSNVPAEEDGMVGCGFLFVGVPGEFRVLYVPAPGTHVVMFRGTRLWVTRSRRASQPNANVQDETLTITMIGRSQDLLRAFVTEAMSLAMKREKCRTVVYVADQYGNWKRSGSKPIRPMESVVLEEGLAENLYRDVTDFLKSEKYYAERGIPYRRGYLLHGPPGCGKTSFMTALAGALGVNIYVINLSDKLLSDQVLIDLLSGTPLRSLLLIEDIDAASQSSDADQGGGVTFSGLLNALDGIVAQEGRSVWMTTNHIEKLSPILMRPGRVDVKAFIGLASKSQIRRLAAKFINDQAICNQIAEKIGDGKISMASMQGFLIQNRSLDSQSFDAAIKAFLEQEKVA